MHNAPPPLNRRARPRTAPRVAPDLPDMLRPLPPATARKPRHLVTLALGIGLSLGGLFVASELMDHCAQDSRFCAPAPPDHPAADRPAPPHDIAQTAPAPPTDVGNPVEMGQRPVLAHAFDPLPLSLDREAARNYTLPPGRSVQDVATEVGAINLSELSLIAIVRQPGGYHALVRLPDGRILRVVQGDRVDDATVAAISEDALFLLGADQRPIALHFGG